MGHRTTILNHWTASRVNNRNLHHASHSPTFLFGRLMSMPELQELFNRHRKYILFLLSFYVLGWGFTSYQSIFLGLILGTSVSLFSHWLIMRRTLRFGDAVVAGQKVRSLGTYSRMAGAAFVAIIAIEYPEYFHLYSAIIGLMTIYIVIMIDYFIQQLQPHK
ncbi:ATP synthase subunit I [Rossellomorea marisflavi]